VPIYMDRHDLRGLKANDVAEAHRRDVDIQDRHGVKYMAYWFDENNGAAFCLVHAPDPATAELVHREAHGEIPNAIIPVDLAAVEAFLGRIGDPRPIHVQEHAVFVGKARQRLNFFGTVYRSHLCGLRDRNDARLRVMLVADAVVGVAHGIERNLTRLVRQRNQLASGVFFRRATFVGVDMSVVAAKDGLEGSGQCLQSEDIRSSPIEGEKNCNVGAEMLFELSYRRSGIRIASISHYVPLIRPRNRL